MTDAIPHQAEPVNQIAAEVEKLGQLVAESAGCREWADFRLRKLVDEMSESRRIAGMVLLEGVLANCMNYFRAESECANAVLAACTGAAGGGVSPPPTASPSSADADADGDEQAIPEDEVVISSAAEPVQSVASSSVHGLFVIPATWPGTGMPPDERDARRIEILSIKLDLFLAEWRIHNSARALLVGRGPDPAGAVADVQGYCQAIINACREEQRLFLSFATWVNALWNAHTTEQCAGLYQGGRSGGSESDGGMLPGGLDQVGLPGLCLAAGALLGWVAQFLMS